MGVEVRESPVSEQAFTEMRQFVRDYLAASVETEQDGGRMRWYPWHSAAYRFNHIENVVELSAQIARAEGANVDATRTAALFHDIAKLEVEQDAHADEGAQVAEKYLTSHGEYPSSFTGQVTQAVRDHSYQGPVTDLPLETQCLVEADVLDKVGANGVALVILRMGYEARTHTDAPKMIDRVIERGEEALDRVESQTALDIAHRRLKRARWFSEWLGDEVAGL